MPKKSTVKTGARKTASKTAIQETAEATDDLTGNKIADRVTSLSKKKSSQDDQANNEMEIPKERYISLEKDNKLLMN